MHSARRRSAWEAGRRRPVRPISPKQATPVRIRVRLAAEAIASAIPRSRAGLVDSHAAGHVDEDVGLTQRDARVPAENGPDHREPLRVDARGHPARHGEVGRCHECLDLEEQRPGALERARHDRAGCVGLPAPEHLRRIFDSFEAALGHLEDAELVRRAEPVLHCSEHAVGAVAVALEREHAVDEVLEDAGARDGAVLRDVPDDEDRNALLLCDAQQPRGRLAHLGNRARSGAELRSVEGLDRVDDAHLRALALERRADEIEIRLGEDQHLARSAEPLGPELHLGGRLLAGDQRGLPLVTHRPQRHQEQRRLADAGVAAHQHERRGDEAAPEHAVELRHACRQTFRCGRFYRRERNQRYGVGSRRRAVAAVCQWLLDESSPAPASGAAPEPARRRIPALRAHVLNGNLRHPRIVESAPDATPTRASQGRAVRVTDPAVAAYSERAPEPHRHRRFEVRHDEPPSVSRPASRDRDDEGQGARLLRRRSELEERSRLVRIAVRPGPDPGRKLAALLVLSGLRGCSRAHGRRCP